MDVHVELFSASVFSGICIALALIYWYVSRLYTYFDKLDIPGPVPSFFFGTWKESTRKFLGDVDIENAKLYGKIYGTFDGITPNLMVIDEEVIKQILQDHADKFHDRRIESVKNPMLKKSLLTLYREEDKEVQALSNSLLSDSVVKMLFPRLEQSASSLVQKIQKLSEEKDGCVNVTLALNEYIHDLIAFSIFGIELNADVTFKDEFISYCDQILTIKNPQSKLTLIAYLYDSLQGDNWIFPQKALDYFVNLIETGIRDTSRNSASTEDKGANLIELLLEASEKEKKLAKEEKETDNDDLILTDEFIIVKCLSTILALINSARTILQQTIYSLANEHEVQDELSKELEKYTSENISFANIQDFRFMDMIIAEVLRLYPSEIRLEKVCKTSVTIEKLDFKNGSRVSIPLYALHRYQQYNSNPETFDVRRFSSEEQKNSFTYLPFGSAGTFTRSISLQLVLLASKITIFKLIKEFKIKGDHNVTPSLFKKGITGVPKVDTLKIMIETKK